MTEIRAHGTHATVGPNDIEDCETNALAFMNKFSNVVALCGAGPKDLSFRLSAFL